MSSSTVGAVVIFCMLEHSFCMRGDSGIDVASINLDYVEESLSVTGEVEAFVRDVYETAARRNHSLASSSAKGSEGQDSTTEVNHGERDLEMISLSNTFQESEGNSSQTSKFSGGAHQYLGNVAYDNFLNYVKTDRNIARLGSQQITQLVRELEVLKEPRSDGHLTFGDFVFLAGDFYSGELMLNDKLLMDPSGTLEAIKQEETKELLKLLQYTDRQRLQGIDADGDLLRNVMQLRARGMAYLRLAEKNFNHFGEFARIQYAQIHGAALRRAQSQNISDLVLALELEGTACHYFSDLFASGHMRVPRDKLHRACPIDYRVLGWLTPMGGFLSKCMHDEDGVLGLIVTSAAAQGSQWTAYGDGYFFIDENEANRDRAVVAVATSIKEVFKAFLHTRFPTDFVDRPPKLENYAAFQHIPAVLNGNNPPLAEVNTEGEVMGRVVSNGSLPEYKKLQPSCQPHLLEECIPCADFVKIAITARSAAVGR